MQNRAKKNTTLVITIGLTALLSPLHAMEERVPWIPPNRNWVAYESDEEHNTYATPFHIDMQRVAAAIEAEPEESSDEKDSAGEKQQLFGHNSFPFPVMCAQARLTVPIQMGEQYACTPLHQAVKTDNLATVQQLLKQGDNPNVADTRNLHSFYYACMGKKQKNQLSIVRELYLAKADDPELRLEDLRDDILEVILSIDYEFSMRIQTSLKTLASLFLPEPIAHIAAEYDDPSTRLHPLKQRHQVPDDEKETLLINAATHDYLNEALRAFYLGVNINAKCIDNRTALHHAALHSTTATVTQMLLEYKAEIDVQDNGGQTSLHLATINGVTSIAALLLAHKANPLTQDNDKRTPLNIATQCGRTEIIKLMEKAIKDRD